MQQSAVVPHRLAWSHRCEWRFVCNSCANGGKTAGFLATRETRYHPNQPWWGGWLLEIHGSIGPPSRRRLHTAPGGRQRWTRRVDSATPRTVLIGARSDGAAADIVTDGSIVAVKLDYSANPCNPRRVASGLGPSSSPARLPTRCRVRRRQYARLPRHRRDRRRRPPAEGVA